MNVLFLSLFPLRDMNERGIYPDLLREFVKRGHYVRAVSPIPEEPDRDIRGEGYGILQVNTPPMQKTNFISKGINSLRIGPILRRAIAKRCAGEHYDLILVATPPITIAGTVEWVKRRDGSKVYLLLKDIWPQGIVDLGAISQNGLVYKYYRSKEKKLYALADRIGCMSPANVRFLLEHNSQLSNKDVEEFPNCIEISDPPKMDSARRNEVRRRYGLDPEATVFVIGGNLSKGHDFPFALSCFYELEQRGDPVQLLFVGAGTNVKEIQDFIAKHKSRNLLYVPMLSASEYEELTMACDIGLILLDHRFTVPNFPSRLLSYMKMRKPVFAVTDAATDVGRIAAQNEFGWWCLDGDREGFFACMEQIRSADFAAMGEIAFAYMKREYDVEKNASKILDAEL